MDTLASLDTLHPLEILDTLDILDTSDILYSLATGNENFLSTLEKQFNEI